MVGTPQRLPALTAAGEQGMSHWSPQSGEVRSGGGAQSKKQSTEPLHTLALQKLTEAFWRLRVSPGHQPSLPPHGRGEGMWGEWGGGGRSPARTTHLVEVRELGPAAAIQVEAGVAGGVHPAVPGEGTVPQHLGGVRGVDGQEVAASAEGSGAPPQGCVALVLEVLEGGGAIGGAEREGHARNVAFVPERAGQGAVEGSRLVP